MSLQTTSFRTSKRIEKDVSVAILEGAKWVGSSHPHRYFVSRPVEPGPQPFILEIRTGVGREIRWGVAILPEDAPYTPVFRQRTYGSLLSLIRKSAAKKLTEAESDARYTRLAQRSFKDEPFHCRHCDPLTDGIKHFGAAFNQISAVRKSLRADFEKLQRLAADTALRWQPFHAFDATRSDEEEIKRHCDLIMRWPIYRRRKMSRVDCLREYVRLDYEEAPSNQEEFKAAYERFKEICFRLRLAVTGKAKRGTKNVAWLEWLGETKR